MAGQTPPLILHAMLGGAFGGLEQVFLDYQPILQRIAGARGGACVALARRGGPAAGRAARTAERLELALAFSDWDPVSLASVAAVVRRHRPSLAVAHGQRAYRLLARSLPAKTPIIAVIHKPKFDIDLIRTHYVCVAAHLAEAARRGGAAAERVHVAPNAVALDGPRVRAASPGDRPIIVAGGRLHEKKGFDILIRAIALLRDRGVAAEARIAGEGPERSRLAALIAELGLADQVALCGWTEDLPAFLAQGDVFALPSYQEGFPLVLLQAMAAASPIVASAIDGPNEMLIEDVSGRLVPAGDPQALADALTVLLTDRAHAARLGAAARCAVERNYGAEALERRLTEAVEAASKV